MLPTELPQKTIHLPETDNHSIVLVTGNELRHQRFAYRIQKAFGESVVAWYALDSTAKSSNEVKPAAHSPGPSKLARIRSMVNKLFTYIRGKGLLSFAKEAVHAVKTRYRIREHYRSHAEAERRLFGKEIELLKQHAHLKPIRIHPSFVHDEAFIEQIKQLDPYFFLTLGGPLYKKKLLNTIRGVAINQHAGHSPDLKGSQTVEWALYHRNLSRVSSTVHITGTGADSGPILRRSSPCMFPTDTVPTIFARVVALGTELMIEAVEGIIANKETTVFEQPASVGTTYLSKELNTDVLSFILSDFRSKWLEKALLRQRSY